MNQQTTPETDRRFIITIGRQFGSGGRELGRKLSDKFGIAYYDKKLLWEAAGRAGMSPEFLEKHDERMPNLLGSFVGFNMGSGQLPWYNGEAMMTDSIYNALADVMEHLAETKPCVIVGRSADHVLRANPVPRLSIFVHAPMEVRIERILARSKDIRTKNAARNLAEKTDRLRASYYNFYTDKKWGDAASYDLTLDSSLISMDDICDIVDLYIRKRYGFSPLAL